MKIYRNYGVLGAEKRTVYTCDVPHDMAIASDEIEIELPKGWKAGKNVMGLTLVESPSGQTFLMRHILGGDEYPCFIWYDGIKTRINRLKVRSI